MSFSFARFAEAAAAAPPQTPAVYKSVSLRVRCSRICCVSVGRSHSTGIGRKEALFFKRRKEEAEEVRAAERGHLEWERKAHVAVRVRVGDAVRGER